MTSMENYTVTSDVHLKVRTQDYQLHYNKNMKILCFLMTAAVICAVLGDDEVSPQLPSNDHHLPTKFSELQEAILLKIEEIKFGIESDFLEIKNCFKELKDQFRTFESTQNTHVKEAKDINSELIDDIAYLTTKTDKLVSDNEYTKGRLVELKASNTMPVWQPSPTTSNSPSIITFLGNIMFGALLVFPMIGSAIVIVITVEILKILFCHMANSLSATSQEVFVGYDF